MGWNPDKKVKIACVTIPGSKFSPEQNNGNGIMTFQTLKRGRFFILSRSVLFFCRFTKKPLQEEHWYKTFLCDDKNAFLTIMSYHIFLFAPRLLNKKKSPWKSKYKLAGITRENAKFWKKKGENWNAIKWIKKISHQSFSSPYRTHRTSKTWYWTRQEMKITGKNIRIILDWNHQKMRRNLLSSSMS